MSLPDLQRKLGPKTFQILRASPPCRLAREAWGDPWPHIYIYIYIRILGPPTVGHKVIVEKDNNQIQGCRYVRGRAKREQKRVCGQTWLQHLSLYRSLCLSVSLYQITVDSLTCHGAEKTS